MPVRVLEILFGALFTVALSSAIGGLVIRRLGVFFFRYEAALFGFLTGSAVLSLATFLLCLVHQARAGVFLASGAAVIAWSWWEGRGAPRRKALPRPSRSSLALWLLVIGPFFLMYLIRAVAPEVSPDGSGYHLGNVARMWRLHGFDWGHQSMYSYLPQGAEMLYLVAYSFGGPSATALIHLCFLTALPLLMGLYGCRFRMPEAGLFGGAMVYAAPIAGLAGSAAYNDLAVVTLTYAGFYLLQVMEEIEAKNLLIMVGLIAGFAFSVKYTAFLLLPFAVGVVILRSHDARWPRASFVLMGALVMMAPWLARNWFWVQNPVAPFLNQWFPNAHFHPSEEQSYVASLSHYEGINHYWEIPLQLTVHGGLIQGMIGPVFLLAPLALLALRRPEGRRLLLAAAVFAVPAYWNTGARFLLPSLPFLSLAMGYAVSNSAGVLPAMAVLQALVCWPAVLGLYCDPASWRIREVPVRAALRLETEDEHLKRYIRDYSLKESIERNVAMNERIFSFTSRAEGYIGREIVVSYESAEGNRLQDILRAPVFYANIERTQFRLPGVRTAGVRLRQTARSPGGWSLWEMRVSYKGRELAIPPGVHVTASPNRYEAGLAFDGSPVTRWSTWQASSPGDFVEVDFGREEWIDEVRLETGGEHHVQFAMEARGADGRWGALTSSVERFREEPAGDARRLAAQQLIARNVRFLLVDDADYLAADFKRNASAWGLTRLAESNGTTFYRIG